MECQVLIKHTSAKITRVRLGLCVQSVVCSECGADKLRGDCTTCCTTTTASPPTFLNTTPLHVPDKIGIGETSRLNV